jgi:hypothetical protein
MLVYLKLQFDDASEEQGEMVEDCLSRLNPHRIHDYDKIRNRNSGKRTIFSHSSLVSLSAYQVDHAGLVVRNKD